MTCASYLLLFERCQNLGIEIEQLDQWAEFVSKFSSTDFPKEEFCQAALRLHQLEGSVGKSFEILSEEYEKTKEDLDQLHAVVDSLVTKKEQLVKEIKPLSIQVDALTKEKVNRANKCNR